jgi:hypothetical protein
MVGLRAAVSVVLRAMGVNSLIGIVYILHGTLRQRIEKFDWDIPYKR